MKMTTKFKSIRTGHRSAVSRNLRRFEKRSETEEKPEEDELETIIDTLKESQDILKDLNKNILESVQEEEEIEETHTTEDKSKRNSINIEHISTIVDMSRTKQRTTAPLKENETDKSALVWTKDTNKNK
ncbi:Hypothetical predicted protein [Mytilus galloprovincialis]|uniref:Uncharacterized protein n=1 Tax=Mytilus galloprovincialis TaxID=29158 RepID=A0A8B6CDY0_MYTGA|nr:Hypothetical predicted protein [Mytilus galloprovincialis]